MNKIKQGSHQWERIKRYNFGANDIASLLGVGFNECSKVITDKIDGIQDQPDASTQLLMDRGIRYEPVVRTLFKQRHGVHVDETGLKFHPTMKYVTASPDGYCKGPLFDIGPFLTEFKVKTELSEKIPMKYWVQMQVQMEVWNMPHCVYCENVIVESPIAAPGFSDLTWKDQKYYWQLKEYKETVVARDKEWWASVAPKIDHYWQLVEAGRSRPVTRSSSRKRSATQANLDDNVVEVQKRRKFQLQEHTQPYMLSNYFRDDPLLDWLNIYGPMDRKDKQVNVFLTMIRNKNRQFNQLVTDFITNKYTGSVCNICPEPFKMGLEGDGEDVELHKLGFTFENVEKTKAAMERKVPIIINPCFSASLPSYSMPFGGRADMIVLNRYLLAFAPYLIQADQAVEQEDADKYSIVAVKYATINLRADKIHLLNNPKQKVYKAQLWLLNCALGVQQQYVPERGYFIGRKYDYTKRGVTYRITNAFQAIGTVDFTEIDGEYNTECRKALEWLEQVRQPIATTWDPFHPEEGSMVPEGALFPNMKNASDHPWHEYKCEIAKAIKEITLLYHCGPKVRKFAHDRGVMSWQDLTPETIKYNSGKLRDRIMQFVAVSSRPAGPVGGGEYMPVRPCVEFYLDFEAIGNMYDDFSQFPNASSQAMIFLIGLIMVDNVTGKTQYISYLVDQLDHQSERNIVSQMLHDMREARTQYQQDHSPVYFWSNAENYMLKRAMGPNVVQENNLIMVDLCKIFRECGIIVEGQMGFGLKDVAKNMYRHGMIQTTWDESADVVSGLNASVEAMKTYNQRDGESRRQYLKDLIDYNYVDCKVMYEIVEYLRQTVNA